MDEIIFTKIYHGGILSEISVPTYVGNCVLALRYIIKDHFFILELLYYTKELGYETVKVFYVKDLLNKKWVLITTDQHLLHLIKDLKHEDTFEVFVCHVLDEPLLDTKGPRDYLTNVGGESVDVDFGEKGEVVNLGGEGEAVDLGGEGEAVNLGGEGVDVNTSEEGVDDNLGGESVDDNLGGEGHKRQYSSASFAAATGGNRRPTTGFGVYPDPTTGAQVFNPGTLSEKILHGPTKLKSASPINIDIDFKPRSLKWKGKDAVGTSQLQQMKANRKNWK
uniref:Hemolysin-type calcium-binding region n=1 Tax=Solanum tuberosum TaxID=4113 RepID=M1DCP4_SOLTU